MSGWTRHHTRRVILLVCALAVGALLFQTGRGPWKELRVRLHMRELQRQCMERSPPADQIVYCDDRKQMPTLLERDEELTVGRFNFEPNGREMLCRHFDPFTRLCNLPDRTPIPLFLHARKTGLTEQRLVAVLISHRLENSGRPLVLLQAMSMQSITPWSYPPAQVFDYAMIAPELPNTTPLYFFAGQCDEADGSRFSITFAVGGTTPGVIEGNVAGDGKITLKIISGPANLTAIGK